MLKRLNKRENKFEGQSTSNAKEGPPKKESHKQNDLKLIDKEIESKEISNKVDK